jgi:HlyD family secretion protein
MLSANLAALLAEQSSAEIDLKSNTRRQAVQVKSLSARAKDTEVLAPLDGVVLSRRVELGEVVSLNQDLFTVGDVSRLILEVSVDEADVGRVHDGRDGLAASLAAVSLYAFGSQVFSAKVFEVLPDANRERKAFLAKLVLDEPPRGLRSGMSAEVNIIASEKLNVLLGPSAGVQSGKAWVVRNNRAEQVEVQTGVRDLLRTEITAGMAEGEAVVIEGMDGLKPGARVQVTELPMSKDDPLPEAAAQKNTL